MTTEKASIVTVQNGKKIHLGLNHAVKAGLMVNDLVAITHQNYQFKIAKSAKGKRIGCYGVDVPPSMTLGFSPGDEFEISYSPDEIILTPVNYDD